MNLHLPDYVEFGDEVDEIDFHLPGDVLEGREVFVGLSDEVDKMYHQLINWCIIQSFWYYVYQQPQVFDAEFDYIKKIIWNIEQEHYYEITEGPTMPHVPNGYSPVKAWGNPFRHLPCRYPTYVQELFSVLPKEQYPYKPRVLHEFKLTIHRREKRKMKFRKRG